MVRLKAQEYPCIGPAELLDQKRLEVAQSIHGAKAELKHRAHGRN